jgi:glycosyltransferase involved in cell wall biosynthesis
MRQGCVPVVTRAGALPEVVGNTGVYVDSTDPAVLATGIRHALALGDERRRRARDRILAEFPLARRREGLYTVLREALDTRV